MKTDLSYLFSMSDGDQSIINEMIDIFTLEVKEISDDMLRYESQGNYEALSKLAHKAKSTVAIMGMKRLSDVLKELEIMAKQKKNTDKFIKYINLFIEDCEDAIRELEEYRKNLEINL